MPFLKCPRFAGDTFLQQCADNVRQMRAPASGLSVKRVQAALVDLDFSVGPDGLDGAFGPNTAKAVTAYKTDRGLSPNDPVVGPGTMLRLDDEFFFDPPELDPTFREFSPLVVSRRVEPFVGIELAGFIGAPLDSWRHDIGLFALTVLNSRELLGIVAGSRAEDLRAPFIKDAAPMQPLPNGTQVNADDFFTSNTAEANLPAHGVTIEFTHRSGVIHTFMLVNDNVILGKAVTRHPLPDGTVQTALESIQDVLAHELTHVRNLAFIKALESSPNDDPASFADPDASQAMSTLVNPTAGVMATYVDELVADHVEWVVRKEVEGTPAAIPALAPNQFAAAFRFWFQRPNRFFDNGYMLTINHQSDAQQFRQLDRWMRRAAALTFTGLPSEQARTQALIRSAAAFCADQAITPTDLPEPDGTHPLLRDFH
ncbi:MAG TPA: peptidoglycan-binding protein [Burkholderiaceae bacterium]|nr:peptidoglycan-binding protein [Burkholderiaceae bacterium]